MESNLAKNKTTISSTSYALKAYTSLAIIYILEELLLPVSHAGVVSYHMSVIDYRLALIAVNLPIILVWFVAFWGYSKLGQYSESLKKAPEAHGFKRLSKGLAWLAWSLPVASVVNRVLSGISDHQPKAHGITTILTNYFDLIMPFIALVIISSATRLLLASQKWDLKQLSRSIMSIFFLGGALYCFLILKAFRHDSFSSTHNVYHLPAWLTVITLILPYLYAWFVGLLGAYQLGLFSIRTIGFIYKRALRLIVGGLFAVIISFIVVQYLSAIWPSQPHLIFNYRLIFTTIFRIIGGVGFILLAMGASKLKMIEEV